MVPFGVRGSIVQLGEIIAGVAEMSCHACSDGHMVQFVVLDDQLIEVKALNEISLKMVLEVILDGQRMKVCWAHIAERHLGVASVGKSTFGAWFTVTKFQEMIQRALDEGVEVKARGGRVKFCWDAGRTVGEVVFGNAADGTPLSVLTSELRVVVDRADRIVVTAYPFFE